MFKIKDEIGDAKKIAISGHTRPDGDCVGSCMALAMYLRKVFPERKIDVYLETPPEIFNTIKGVDKIKRADGTKHNYDLAICLDCETSRLGDAEPIFRGAKRRINIDHHITNSGCGDLNYVDPTVGSTSELVYDVIESSQIDEDIAIALYIGIIHDTGVLQYSNTRPKTLRIVAELMEMGFDFSKLIEETFYQKTYIQNQILGRALMESILFMDKKCIFSHIDGKTMKFYGASSKDMDGICSQMRYTKGVDCAVFMYEMEPMKYKVSLRSNGIVDCAKVTSYFGGGGHVRAAGCIMDGSPYDAINNISAQIELQYDQRNN